MKVKFYNENYSLGVRSYFCYLVSICQGRDSRRKILDWMCSVVECGYVCGFL